MAHQSIAHGQPSPPSSDHGVRHVTGFAESPVLESANLAPYNTPPSYHTQAYNYGDPEQYEIPQPQPYHEPPRFYREGTYRTPPQPISDRGIRTRSGRSIGTPTTGSTSSRMSPSPRPKRNRKGKDKQIEYKINEPLSLMTKHYDVPVEDMMAWVNRSNENRYDEVSTKHKGKIPRPMNSFMLYRRAYKERIKKWGAQGDNNQLISSVAGISWNLEPQEVKDFYAKVAIIERDNHTAAFPDYKFAPNKNLKKRDRNDEGNESDGEWEGGSSYSTKRRRGRNGRGVSRSRSTTPALPLYGSPQPHPSSYQASNMGMLSIPRYEQWVPQMSYEQFYPYDRMVYPRQVHGLQYGPTSVPMQAEPYIEDLVGLPPTNRTLMEEQALTRPEIAIDPGLGDYVPQTNYHYGVFLDEHDLLERGIQHVYEGEMDPAVHPGLKTLGLAESPWASKHHAGSAFDAELDRWDASS